MQPRQKRHAHTPHRVAMPWYGHLHADMAARNISRSPLTIWSIPGVVCGVASALSSQRAHEAQHFPIPGGIFCHAVHGEEGSIVRLKIVSEFWIELSYD